MSEAYDYEPEMEDDDEGEDEAPSRVNAEFIVNAPNSKNLAFDLDDTVLVAMGAKVCEEYDIDVASRDAAEFSEQLERAVKLASLTKEAKNTPWDNASNVKFPLVTQAIIQFNARSYPALLDGPNVVKGAIKGRPDEAKSQRADRVSKHMSWQLLEEEEEWEEDTDAMLLRLACVGTQFRKRYFDPTLGRNCSHVIGPEEFVVNYKAKRDLSLVPRQTHILTFYPHEIIEKRRAGLWLDVELGPATDAANDDQAPHTFLEQHRLWDLDEDGYPEPYVITVHKETQKVVRVVARWYPEGVTLNEKGEIAKIKPYECFTKYGFIPNPDGSFYDLGFGTLLGSTSDTINTILNQLMDAATLANLSGGFIGEGVSLKSGNMRFRPGEWKRVGTSGANLSQNIVPLPTKEPSAVLFNLMTFLIDAAKDITATQEILTGDAGKGTMPVGTVQALVEQGLKTFTAIVKRIHRSFKRELKIQFELNARYLEPEVYFTFQDEPQQVIREDYAEGDLDIVPVSDPNMATDLQRMSQAQFVLGLVGTGQVNPRKAVQAALEAARVANAEELLTPEGPPPPDPKAIEAQAKAENEARKTGIAEMTAAADVENKNAQTEKLKLETFMMGPEMAAMLDQAVQTGVEAVLARLNGGPTAPVQQGPVPGMAGPPVDGPVSPIPGGPAPAVDGGLGPGGPVGPGGAGQGQLSPGAYDPGMAGTG